MNKNQIEQFFEIYRNLEKKVIEIAEIKYEKTYGSKPDVRGISEATISGNFPFYVLFT